MICWISFQWCSGSEVEGGGAGSVLPPEGARVPDPRARPYSTMLLGVRRPEGLHAVVPLGVLLHHTGHVMELARVRYLRLRRQGGRLGPLLLLRLPPAPGHGQGYVLRVAYQPLHVLPQLAGRVRRVETEADHLLVVARQAHGVERGSGDPVVGQIIDPVRPEGEARAPLSQHQGHPGHGTGPGVALVVKDHRDAGEDETPVAVVAGAFVEIGQSAAHEDLGAQAAEEALHLTALVVREVCVAGGVRTDGIRVDVRGVV